MIKFRILLVFNFAVQITFGQKNNWLQGTWKSDTIRNVYCNDTLTFIDSDCSQIIITFDKSNAYLTSPNYINRQGSYEDYKLKLNSKVIRINTSLYVDSSVILYQKPIRENFQVTQKFRYEKVNDSIINISEKLNNDNCKKKFRLYKTNKLTYTPSAVYATNYKIRMDKILSNKIVMHKNMNETKKKFIFGRGKLSIHIDTINTCGITNSIVYDIDAFKYNQYDNKLYIHSNQIEESFNDCKGYFGKRTKLNSSFELKDSLTIIKYNQIAYLYYYKPYEFQVHNISKSTGWLALLSTVIIAPLISINYQDFDFNKKRYFNIAGVSLGLSTLSFIIATLTNGKQYLIGDKFAKNGWTIE